MTYGFNARLSKFMSHHSRLYFLVKDTQWTFIWWYISPNDINLVFSKLSNPKHSMFVLRVYDVTHIIFNGENAHKYFDVEVSGFTDHWYLKIHENKRNYIAEAGFRDYTGQFYPVIRSNTIFLPPGRGEDSERQWERICI